MRRKTFCLGALAACETILAPLAFSQPRLPLVGYLNPLSAANAGLSFTGFRDGLRALGYIEGKNIVVEYRFADNDLGRLTQHAADLVKLRPDVLVSFAQGLTTLRQATSTIPIVMAVSADPILAGLAASLSRPGGNATGLALFTGQLTAKRVQLLKEIRPEIRTVGVLVFNPDAWNDELRESARATNVQMVFATAKGPLEFGRAFQELLTARIDGLVLSDHPLFVGNAIPIAEFAKLHRIPAASPMEIAERGFIAAYGVEYNNLFERAAGFVHRILQGQRPAEMPIERPTHFRTAVNLRVAKELKITIPQSILITADQVIS